MEVLANFKHYLEEKMNVRPGPSGHMHKILTDLYGKDVNLVPFSITDAQIGAGHTTPVDILAAPGANKVSKVLGGFARLNYLTAAYNAVNAEIRWDGVTNNLIVMDGLEATANAFWDLSPAVIQAALSATSVNKKLIFETSGATGTTGKGTIDGILLVRTIDLSVLA